jgi:hypothetical protein
MKKLLILFIGMFSMPILNAQDISDALRYSNGDVQGTARFRAMSGAFGALGGDLSAVSINPAGSAIFNNSYASLSISNYNNDTKTNYFGTLNSDSNSSFDLNQAGAVFVFNNTDTLSPWGRFTLGLTYEKTQNFGDDFFASGTNTRSIDSYFLSYAQGLRLDEISAFDGESISDAYGDIGAVFGHANQQAFIGYESYILEPDADDDANTTYTSNIAPGTFNQKYSYAALGYNGKFGVNGAIQYDDDIYLGLNLNSHFINYERSTYLSESNSNLGSLVNEVGFENNLSTIGSGFSFQLGTIAKINETLRVGFTFDSPIWYTISEETTQYLSTVRDDAGTEVTTTLNPQVVNVFQDYKLQTPAKITGSAALVLNKKAIISFDYSRKDYSKTKFKPETDSHFTQQNAIISNSLKAANTYKFGGELRHKELSFRGGYKFEESPYEDTSFYGDLKGYSLGLGYNFGGTTLDLAYENSERTMNHQLYNIGLTDSAKLNTDNSLVTLTLSMKL